MLSYYPTYANGPTPPLPIAGAGYSANRQNLGEIVLRPQPAPAAYAAVATLTAADLAKRMIVASGTTYTLTLPTAALLDALLTNAQQDDSFDFSINVTASGTITLGMGTGITASGTMTVATATAAIFRLRKTNAPGAASAWTCYRVG